MAKKKKRTLRSREEIEKAVIDYIEDLDFPTTTGNIAEGVGLNWYAASYYLHHLKDKGRVFHKKVGRQNQWWTEKVDEQRKKIRVQEMIINELERKLNDMVKEKDEEIEKLRKENMELKKRIKG